MKLSIFKGSFQNEEILLKIHHAIVCLALKHEPCSLPIDIAGTFIKFNRSETHPSFIS